MKKVGPLLLVVAIAMIGYLLVREDPMAADFKTDMNDIVLQGMGQGEERSYIEKQVSDYHSAAARACKGASQEEAFRIYMREQFKNLIAQSERDGRKELSRTVQGLAHQTMGPREFAKPAAAKVMTDEHKAAAEAPPTVGAEPSGTEPANEGGGNGAPEVTPGTAGAETAGKAGAGETAPGDKSGVAPNEGDTTKPESEKPQSR